LKARQSVRASGKPSGRDNKPLSANHARKTCEFCGHLRDSISFASENKKGGLGLFGRRIKTTLSIPARHIIVVDILVVVLFIA
jgi:hypothetical protein